MSKKHKVMAAAAGATSPVTSDPEAGAGILADLADAEIAARAYSYWESRGFQGGSAEDDWYRAVDELKAETQSQNRR